VITRPFTSQADRDLLAVVVLGEDKDRAGSGDHAERRDEPVAS
jgi:hypothetical protein